MMDCKGLVRIVRCRGHRAVRSVGFLGVLALAVLSTLSVGAEMAANTAGVVSITEIKGTVTGVSGTTLTVRQTDGTTASFTLNAQTGYLTTVARSVSDLKAGDLVMVQGDKASDGTYRARTLKTMGDGFSVAIRVNADGKEISASGTPAPAAIAIDGVPAGKPGVLAGTIVTGKGDFTVGAPPNVTAGENITYIAAKPGDGTMPVIGKVTKIEGTTLTLSQPDGTTVTVTTDAQTVVSKDEKGSLSALKTGDTVSVASRKADDGSSVALMVRYGTLIDG